MIWENAELLSLIPGPVLNWALLTEEKPRLKSRLPLCSHCHRPIKGKVYQIGELQFDEFCYSLRFSLKLDGARARGAPQPSPWTE